MAADPENTLVIETTKGRVVIELRPDLAPKHVERIKQLAREGFYNGIPFHRVIDGFMAQTGCPKGTGTGGSSYPNLKAEFNAEPHVRGVCSMARSSDRPTAPTASSSSCSTTPPSSTSSTRCGARSSRAWTTSTRSSAASRCSDPDKMVSVKVGADVSAVRRRRQPWCSWQRCF